MLVHLSLVSTWAPCRYAENVPEQMSAERGWKLLLRQISRILNLKQSPHQGKHLYGMAR